MSNAEDISTANGVIYYADSPKYFSEAFESITNIRKFYQDLNICIFTDEKSEGLYDIDWDDLNINVIKLKLNHAAFGDQPHKFYGKVLSFGLSPFDNTIFFDCDTSVLNETCLVDIFSALERYDVLAAHAPLRVPRYWSRVLEKISAVEPELNTGVVAFNSRAKETLKRWEEYYIESVTKDKIEQDQFSFRLFIYDSLLKLGILPEEYNRRPFKRAKPKIIHSHNFIKKKVAKKNKNK